MKQNPNFLHCSDALGSYDGVLKMQLEFKVMHPCKNKKSKL